MEEPHAAGDYGNGQCILERRARANLKAWVVFPVLREAIARGSEMGNKQLI